MARSPLRGKNRVTLDLSNEDFKLLEAIQKKNDKPKSRILRQGIKIVIALEEGRVFLSTSPSCPHQIPSSIL